MNRLIYSVICLLFMIKLSYQISTLTSPTYVAAVVEMQQISCSPIDMFQIIDYNKIIRSEATVNADIIVFPEIKLDHFSLHNVITIQKYITPCDSDYISREMTFVREISCAARDNKKYIVIYFVKHTRYRMNDIWKIIVFDRNGTVISIDHTFSDEYSVDTFETDFGVKFGLLENYDFDELIKRYSMMGITNFIYSTSICTSIFPGEKWIYIDNNNRRFTENDNLKQKLQWAESEKFNMLTAVSSETLSDDVYSNTTGGSRNKITQYNAYHTNAPINIIVATIVKNKTLSQNQTDNSVKEKFVNKIQDDENSNQSSKNFITIPILLLCILCSIFNEAFWLLE